MTTINFTGNTASPIHYLPEVMITEAERAKWEKNGHDQALCDSHPEFVRFMTDSGLLSQMKVTRDEIGEIDNEPAILVEGSLMGWTELKEKFSFEAKTGFGEKFIIDSDCNVHTYLDNGKGLQKYHPYLTKELTPISTVTKAQYDELIRIAKKKEGEECDYIFQIVSSKVDGCNTNFTNFVVNPNHPYIRIITPDLKVYEVGFSWKKKSKIPLVTTPGHFRSPDIWEYKTPEQRVVSNFAINQEDAQSLEKFVMTLHKRAIELGEDIAFNLRQQNCTVFVRNAAKKVGVEVPTEMTTRELIEKVAPDWMKKVGERMKWVASKCRMIGKKITFWMPESVKNGAHKVSNFVKKWFKRIIEGVLALSSIAPRIIAGEASGETGVRLDGDGRMGPVLRNVKKIFKLPKWNMPGLVQEWQLDQGEATQVFEKQVKLAIVK